MALKNITQEELEALDRLREAYNNFKVENKITQEDIAIKLGLSQSRLSQILRSANTVNNIRTLKSICAVLEVPIRQIRTDI